MKRVFADSVSVTSSSDVEVEIGSSARCGKLPSKPSAGDYDE